MSGNSNSNNNNNQEGTNPGSVLQPGQSIKPCVNTNLAIRLIKEHFGHDVVKIKQLNSYDDVNYLVVVGENGVEGEKFIFKILNSMDSVKTGLIEAQHEAMTLLKRNGVNCPIHQLTKEGKIFAHVNIPASSEESNNPGGDERSSTKIHLIRLLSYVEGDLFTNVKLSESLLYHAGSYIAQVDEILKDFHHPALENHTSIWFLASSPQLRKFLYVLDEEPAKHKLIASILEAFENKVIPAYPKLEKGVLHGDFNEQNILCLPSSTNANDFVVHGLIDFGDMHMGYYVFELAVTMCYMMLECIKHGMDPFQGSAQVLAGYSAVRKLTDVELDILRTCIASRLACSLVMGAYTYSQDPGNVYLLTTAKTGWSCLESLWTQTDDEAIKLIWRNAK